MTAWSQIEMLSRRESLLLVSLGLREERWSAIASLLPGEGHATVLDWLARWRSASAAERARCEARLNAASARVRRRFAPIHSSWVERALQRFPDAQGPRAERWLTAGVDVGEVARDASDAHLQRYCMAVFPIGPVHLEVEDEALVHPGHLCRWDASALAGLIERLGLFALALAVQGGGARRIASLYASLTPAYRRGFGAHLERIEQRATAHSRLRLQAQAALLRGRDISELTVVVPRLGLDLLASALAYRFVEEGRFIAARLPHEDGRALRQLLGVAIRRGERVVQEASAEVMAQASECARGETDD